MAALDSLKLATDLADAGLPTGQAQSVARAIRNAVDGDLATTTDIAALRSEAIEQKADIKTDLAKIKLNMGELRSELKSDMVELRSGLMHHIVDLRADLKTEIARLKWQVLLAMLALTSSLWH